MLSWDIYKQSATGLYTHTQRLLWKLAHVFVLRRASWSLGLLNCTGPEIVENYCSLDCFKHLDGCPPIPFRHFDPPEAHSSSRRVRGCVCVPRAEREADRKRQFFILALFFFSVRVRRWTDISDVRQRRIKETWITRRVESFPRRLRGRRTRKNGLDHHPVGFFQKF